MRTQLTEPAFSTRSIFFLLLAVASGLVSIIRDYGFIWAVAEWVCGVSMLALVASLILDARK